MMLPQQGMGFYMKPMSCFFVQAYITQPIYMPSAHGLCT